jgi:hypothetical protein
MSNTTVPWKEVVKKEARGLYDVGEVSQVDLDTVTTMAGITDKITHHLLKSLVDRYDGLNLWFKITNEEAKADME